MNRTAVLAAVVCSLIFAGSSYAADSEEPGVQKNAPNEMSKTVKKSGAKTPQERARNTEQRIKELHDELGVSKEQEAKWAEVAKTMRDNDAVITALIEERRKNAEKMTALDDLQSYEDITQAHADGIKKMITSFEPLYDDMSDEQKKNADKVFNNFRAHRGKQGATSRPGGKQ